MNFLNLRKGPPMEFIIGEHRNEFENHVIDVYMEGVKEFIVPTIDDLVFPNLNAKYTLAGFLGHATGDLSFYIKEYQQKLLPDFERYWAASALNQYARQYQEDVLNCIAGTHSDAISVFDFHNMFHIVEIGEEIRSGDSVVQFRNVPIIEVW